MKNKNLCKDCKFAKWEIDSIEPPNCESIPLYLVRDEGNYTVECSSYQSKNNILKYVGITILILITWYISIIIISNIMTYFICKDLDKAIDKEIKKQASELMRNEIIKDLNEH